MRLRAIPWGAAAVIGALFPVTPAAGAAAIKVVGDRPGTVGSEATGVNNAGIVIGSTSVGYSSADLRPLVDPGFSGQAVQPIPSNAGPGRAVAIAKNSNAIAGNGGPKGNAWVWSGAPGANISFLDPLSGGAPGEVSGINSTGAAVGGSNMHAFYHAGKAGGTTNDLGTGLNSVATDINDAGAIVGIGIVGNSPFVQGFVFPPGESIRSLGDVNPVVINERGAIAGYSYYPLTPLGHGIPDMGTHGFRHNGGINDTIQELPSRGGNFTWVRDMNDLGFIVGTSEEQTNSEGLTYRSAVLWRPDNTLVDLDAYLDQVNPVDGAKWTLFDATGINNSGIIVGNGVYNDGSGEVIRGFVLDASDLVVPEPAGVAPVVGLFAFQGLRRRSRRAHSY